MRLVLTPPMVVVCPRILHTPWHHNPWQSGAAMNRGVVPEVFHEGGLSCEGDSHSMHSLIKDVRLRLRGSLCSFVLVLVMIVRLVLDHEAFVPLSYPTVEGGASRSSFSSSFPFPTLWASPYPNLGLCILAKAQEYCTPSSTT